jgi:hypothetical protein
MGLAAIESHPLGDQPYGRHLIFKYFFRLNRLAIFTYQKKLVNYLERC